MKSTRSFAASRWATWSVFIILFAVSGNIGAKSTLAEPVTRVAVSLSYCLSTVKPNTKFVATTTEEQDAKKNDCEKWSSFEPTFSEFKQTEFRGPKPMSLFAAKVVDGLYHLSLSTYVLKFLRDDEKEAELGLMTLPLEQCKTGALAIWRDRLALVLNVASEEQMPEAEILDRIEILYPSDKNQGDLYRGPARDLGGSLLPKCKLPSYSKSALFWNTWLTKNDKGVIGETTSDIKLKETYRLFLDLSALNYAASGAARAVDHRDNRGIMSLTAVAGMNGGSFQILPVVIEGNIKITENSATAELEESRVKAAAINIEGQNLFLLSQDASLLKEKSGRRGISFQITTQVAECATIALFIWNQDWSRQIDYLVRNIKVSSGAQAVSTGSEDCNNAIVSLPVDTPNLARLSVAARTRVDAALTITETPADSMGTVITVAALSVAGETDEPINWNLTETTNEMVTGLEEMIGDYHKNAVEYDLGNIGKRLQRYLFPATNSEEEAARMEQALQMLRKLSMRSGESRPKLFMQVIRSGNRQIYPPIQFLPAAEDGIQPIGALVDIIQPMLAGRRSGNEICIDPWNMAVMDNLVQGQNVPVINEIAKALDTDRNMDWDMLGKYFRNQAGKRIALKGEGLILMSHFFGNQFSKDGTTKWTVSPSDISRPYNPGSVAVLVACSVANSNAKDQPTGMLDHLRKRGIEAAIVSPVVVDPLVGEGFVVEFGNVVKTAWTNSSKQSLRALFTDAIKNLTNSASLQPDLYKQSYEFMLIGNGDLKICAKQ